MINRYKSIVILSLLIAGILFFLRERLYAPSSSKTTQKRTQVDTFKYNGKRVFGLPPGNDGEDQLKNLKVANTPSKEWEAVLKTTLREQGGDSVKEISLKKVDSFVWAQDGIALYIESVIVTLKNDKNAESSFRVLVDAQTGKILNNWDQPVFDPLHPKDNFKIKIDPRYHND